MHLDLHRPPQVLARAALRKLTQPMGAAVRELAGAIRSVATAEPAVALTFDDGPDGEITPQLLEILRRYDARATFFVVGENAEQNLPLVRHMAEAGHTIANHTWSHLALPLLTPAERWGQLCACESVLAPYGARLFRPPYGQQSWHGRWQTKRLGYEVIGFSVHAEDWLARPAAWMAARLIECTRPGSIIILHDRIYRNVLPNGAPDRQPMLAALDLALKELRRRFSFVTVPELLATGKAVRVPWCDPCPPALEPALRREIAKTRLAEQAAVEEPHGGSRGRWD